MKEELVKLYKQYIEQAEEVMYCPECGLDAMCPSSNPTKKTSFQGFMEWLDSPTETLSTLKKEQTQS